MVKKYTWVVLVLMVITMLVILVGKIKNGDSKIDEKKQEGISQNDLNKNNSVIFYDESGNKVEASFFENGVTFNLSSIGTLTLKQVISASGARYANEDESIVFWNKGDELAIYEKDKMIFSGSTRAPGIKPVDNNTIPKGKLPAGSAPAVDPKIIQSKTWVWEKTVMSDGTVVVPKKVGTFTLSMKSDGNMSGKTDCNGFFGEYKIGTDSVISFGPIGSTLMYCDGSQEQIYTSAINASNKYSLDSSGNLILTLSYDAGFMLFKEQKL